GQFEISAGAIKAMIEYRQIDSESKEAGGVLLGRHILGTEDIIVDFVTVPLIGDRRKRYSFFRSRKAHQQAIDHAWEENKGTCVYLGEWHTHPEPLPTPSSDDWQEWRRKLYQDQFVEPIFSL